jgi:ethanolamine utilization cobalamin adenosyltransferase
LRDLYRKEPFTTYEIEPGARLTPGARQYLADRGINMFDYGPCANKSTENVKLQSAALEKKNNLQKKKLHCRMKSMEALFLLTGEELLSGDGTLAQSVIDLGKQFSNIKNALDGKGTIENLCCKECTGIKEANFSNNLEDCFEITEVHIELKKGRDIMILHRLRCTLREIEPEVLELYEGSKDENELCKDIIGKVNQIINTLSQMICSVVGGKVCQKIS